MRKNLLFLSFAIFSFIATEAQTKKEWTLVQNSKDITISKTALRPTFPKTFTLFKLNFESIKEKLYAAQDRFVENGRSAVIEIPNAKGQLELFKMYEASNFDAELQAQFPDIRSYVGQSLDDNHAQVRLSISPQGIQTMIFRADNPNEYMEVYSADKTVYAVFNKSMENGRVPYTCSTLDEKMATDLINSNTERSSDVVLRTFRLAMSVTGEYSAYHGGTTSSVLAAVNNTMVRVNGVFEKDLAIRMTLVNNTTILYLNAGSDPYGVDDTNYNSELQATLTAEVGEANYDVGHLMSAIGNNGNAGCIGCVCTDGTKGSGFTTSTAPIGDNFDIDFVVHELGHQFGANHSFTFSTENNTVNYEVGSGVTIMGYAGITPYDVAPHSIETFHAGNIAQIQANMAGKTCEIEQAITHSAPVVNAGADFTVPRSTPFQLTGSATDAGGAGAITYQWEQYNEVTAAAQLTTGSPAAVAKTAGPNFRTYLPTTSPTWNFPIMASTLAGSKTTAGADILVEALSSVARGLNFRLTARDNVLNGGQTSFDNMVVTVANIAPLDVTSQNIDGISYTVGSAQTVTWTSAGNSGIAGGANVDISFSADNGVTWANILTNTLNDGTQLVTLPAGVSAPYCRFMVKANANIFFNVNTKAFAVGYTVSNSCTTYTNNAVVLVPDGVAANSPGAVASKTIDVPGPATTISDVNVTLGFTHTYIEDLIIVMNHPDATQVALWNRNCDEEFDTAQYVFSDGNSVIPGTGCTASTGTFSPSGSLASYNNKPSNGTWTLLATDNFNVDTGQLENWAIEVCSVVVVNLSTQDFELADFNLYPNPNSGEFTVKFTSDTANDVTVNVVDMRGRQVYEKSFSNTGAFNQSINLNKIQAGVYLVSITDGAKKTVKRIVVE